LNRRVDSPAQGTAHDFKEKNGSGKLCDQIIKQGPPPLP
jgi:translation initiation factor IF-2